MHRLTVLFCLFALIVLPIAASAQTIEEIQQAITATGAQWTADDNEVWQLHQEQGMYPANLMLPTVMPGDPWFYPKGDLDVPTHLDWRDYGGANYVSKIKNQGGCGSCWAFATTGPVESAIAIAEGWDGAPLALSEQQMLSCDDSPGNLGCNGGFTNTSFNYVRDFGLFDEECLWYHGDDSWPCSDRCEDWNERLWKIDSWEWVCQISNPPAIIEALQIGPVGTSLTIYNDFYSYTGGIYETVLGIPQGFHAVTIVGYDSEEEYWICKNSWGKNWGEDGYFRIKWNASAVGIFTILPRYESQGLGPWEDDDAADDDDDDDATQDDDDNQTDDDQVSDDDDEVLDDDDQAGDDDDDDDDSGCGK